MFEHHKSPLLPRSAFIQRLINSILLALAIVILSLYGGMCGYHYLEGIDWVDAYLDASMILSGMGPVSPLHTTAGKIFAGSYALYSGFTLLVTVSIVLAPIVHRFLHRLHLDIEEEDTKK